MKSPSTVPAAARAPIPRDECAVNWYHLPLWEYSYTQQFKSGRLYSKPLKALARMPVLLAEWFFKGLQKALTALHLLSAAGLTFIVDKAPQAQAPH